MLLFTAEKNLKCGKKELKNWEQKKTLFSLTTLFPDSP
jgi:hypothetical protein